MKPTPRDGTVSKTLCQQTTITCNNSLFFSEAKVDIAMPSPCSASAHAISVKAFRWRIWEKYCSVHVTRNALAALNNEAYMDKATTDCTVFLYRPSLSLKTLDSGILLLAVFKLELEMDYSSETGLYTIAPSPTETSSPFFFWGEGSAAHRLSETDNPSSNCPSKLTDKVRRIAHSKLKPFPFQIKTYYGDG